MRSVWACRPSEKGEDRQESVFRQDGVVAVLFKLSQEFHLDPGSTPSTATCLAFSSPRIQNGACNEILKNLTVLEVLKIPVLLPANNRVSESRNQNQNL